MTVAATTETTRVTLRVRSDMMIAHEDEVPTCHRSSIANESDQTQVTVLLK